ncbi:MAG: sigma-70 family RNA polymerase sigma factor, partial [Actinomycetota bacterium]|nr:sigma-70 family RNA polymerase sigma factor [Actinomycetota bacterium]
MTDSAAHAAVESVVRMESARLIAGLARYAGDLGLAEELAQDAVVAALEQWPGEGVPRNPGAWLMTVAKRRAVDLFRRNHELRLKYAQIGRALEAEGDAVTPDFDRAFSDDIDDDLLRLIFTACHPVLAVPARVALTLRLLGGLTTAEIARAYLIPEATVAQRIVRAKKALAQAQVPFEVPGPAERPARLASVLEVVYLIFNEGYSASAGEDLVRGELTAEAIRLGTILCGLMPDEAEVLGLTALMLLQDSRRLARQDDDGRLMLLPDQDRRRWDAGQIERGCRLLDRAVRFRSPGPYQLQAAIAALHARAPAPEETDWPQIAALYRRLWGLHPTPVVALNRAVAIAMAAGPEAGLEDMDAAGIAVPLAEYLPFHAGRAELLRRA